MAGLVVVVEGSRRRRRSSVDERWIRSNVGCEDGIKQSDHRSEKAQLRTK
jgi:hypothetical protein